MKNTSYSKKGKGAVRTWLRSQGNWGAFLPLPDGVCRREELERPGPSETFWVLLRGLLGWRLQYLFAKRNGGTFWTFDHWCSLPCLSSDSLISSQKEHLLGYSDTHKIKSRAHREWDRKLTVKICFSLQGGERPSGFLLGGPAHFAMAGKVTHLRPHWKIKIIYTWLEKKSFESRDYVYSRSDIGRTPTILTAE